MLRNYGRNTWFDLEPRPWSTSLETMEMWGLKYQQVEHIVHDLSDRIVTVRTQTLERFLAKVVSVLNITIKFVNSTSSLKTLSSMNSSDIKWSSWHFVHRMMLSIELLQFFIKPRYQMLAKINLPNLSLKTEAIGASKS